MIVYCSMVSKRGFNAKEVWKLGQTKFKFLYCTAFSMQMYMVVSKREIITCSVSNPVEYFYDHILVDFMQGQKVPAS